MPQLPAVTTEMLEFLKKIFILTRQGALAWETTADPRTLVAPIEGEYTLRLSQVEDLDPDSPEPTPDHMLLLSKGRKHLFSIDRRDFEENMTSFREHFKDVSATQLEDLYPYLIFKEIWDHANFKASKISDELDRVNKLLDNRFSAVR